MTQHDVVRGVLCILGSWAAFGSFGVLIKAPAVVAARVDPLVFQSYKTFAVFVTSWLVLAYNEFQFTYWGIVGSLVWVPSGVLAVIAIRCAGLGVSQGIWSGLAVPVSFLWGSIVFGDPVKDWILALLSILVIIIGTSGMTWASSPSAKKTPRPDHSKQLRSASADSAHSVNAYHIPPAHDATTPLHDERTELLDGDVESVAAPATGPSRNHGGAGALLGGLWGRVVGLLAAVATGAFAGTMYVPLHYAGDKAKGIEYLVSFGIGAVVVNAGMLMVYYVALCASGKPLPSFAFRVTLVPGIVTGLLWATGNFCSIYATVFLGQAIGATSTSLSLLVAGLWAVVWYKEIESTLRVAAWFAFAALTLGGVALLILYG